MKHLFYILFFSFSLITYGQDYKEAQTVQKIADESFMLNNGFNSTVLGGTSRVAYKIQLPQNTGSWIYWITTSLNEQNSSIISGITKKIFATALTSAAAVSSAYTGGTTLVLSNYIINNIEIPLGASAISLYILDDENANLFLNKKPFSYYSEGTIERQNQFKFATNQLYNNYFNIGIQNTSTMQRAVYVNLQVYATVIDDKLIPPPNSSNNTIDNNRNIESEGNWSQEIIRKMYNRWYNYSNYDLNLSEEIANNIAICTKDKIISTRTVSDYESLDKKEWNKYVHQLYNECFNSEFTNGWSDEIKQVMLNKWLLHGKNNKNLNNDDAKYIADRTQEHIIAGKSFNDYKNTSSQDWQQYVLGVYNICYNKYYSKLQ